MIGVALTQQFIKKDVRVFSVVQPGTKKMNRIPSSDLIKIIQCDSENYRNLPNLISHECDTFFHLGWKATGVKRNENIFLQLENIRFTIHASRSAKELGCKRFIGAGSQAEYGKTQGVILTPESPTNPDTPYGIAKYAAAKCAELECQMLGLEFVWVRIFSVFGIYDKPTTMISSAIRKFLNNEQMSFTSGEQYWDYLFSEDAGIALYMIGQSKNTRHVYCLGSGRSYKLSYYIYAMRDIINPEYKVVLGNMALNSNQPTNLCVDISSLTNDTGFVPQFTFEDGVRKTIEWMKAEKIA